MRKGKGADKKSAVNLRLIERLYEVIQVILENLMGERRFLEGEEKKIVNVLENVYEKRKNQKTNNYIE